MSECPFHKGELRSDLPPLTERLKRLPIDPERGYPVPFFVAWVNGKPEFQMADRAKYQLCVAQKLCWVCGGKMAGERKAFVIGPMCVVNRVTSEPPSHLECAEWSVKGCPFLSRPGMTRRENEVLEKYAPPAGVMITRNPGAMAIWETKQWTFFPDGAGKKLIRIGKPDSVTWWREGRPATRAEILHSIETGLPLLEQGCPDNQRGMLNFQVEKAMELLPA